MKDGSTTDDIESILGIISRCKGDKSSPSETERKKSANPGEKTNVARKKEAEAMQRASKVNLQKIQDERKQQSMRLQQANVAVTTPKRDSVDLKDRMAHHKKSIQMKVERKRSFAVTSKEGKKGEIQPLSRKCIPASLTLSRFSFALFRMANPSDSKEPPPPAAPVSQKAPRKKSSRASIYALASSTQYVDDEESDQEALAPLPKPKQRVSVKKKTVRQPSGIMPASRMAKPKVLSGLSAIGEGAEEEAPPSPAKKTPPPPPPSSSSPRKSQAAAKPAPPPPKSPAASPAPQKKVSLVQARASMFQQKDQESARATQVLRGKKTTDPRERSPSPPVARRKNTEASETMSDLPSPAPPSPAPVAPPPVAPPPAKSPAPPAPKSPKKEAPPPPTASAPKPKRQSFMSKKLDASSQPDLAEAKSTINMLKMELQKEKDKNASAEKKIAEANTELGTLTTKYKSVLKERDNYLENISALKSDLDRKDKKLASANPSADLDEFSEEKENLREENSNLLQSEALLLRTVMESSEMLGALSSRLWQVCEADDKDDGESPSQGDETDADLTALRHTISSLTRAVGEMESEKLVREEEEHMLEKKLKREQQHKKRMEQQIKEEGEVTSALISEAETAAVEGEDMRAMMEEFKTIAEERSNELEAVQGQKDKAYSELARITRDYDLLRTDVDQAVEKALAEERTRSVAHLKSELSREKQKYEAMLEDLLRDEEERSKQEESQAEQIEAQVNLALKENERVLQERLEDLEEEFASKIKGTSEAGKGELAAASAEIEALKAKVVSLETQVAEAEKGKKAMGQRVSGMASEIRVLSARTSSAYRAVESFVDQSTTFADSSISSLLQRAEDFASSIEMEGKELSQSISKDLEEIALEINTRLPMEGAIDFSPSPTVSVTEDNGEEDAEGEEQVDKPAASPKKKRQSTVSKTQRRKSTAKAKKQEMVHVDLSELPQDLVNPAVAKSQPEPKQRRRSAATSVTGIAGAGSPFTSKGTEAEPKDTVKKADLALLSEEIQDSVRSELRMARQEEDAMRSKLSELREAFEAVSRELESCKANLETSREKEEEADMVCAAVEAQCRTLALELAAQRLVAKTDDLAAEEDTLMDMGKPSSGAKSAVPEFTTNRLVVPVDVMKDTLPHYTLLELSDVGMKLANSEVALSRKQEWDFPWDRVNQITVGIANEFVSLDLFEHANAEAAHLRIRDVRHLNTVLTIITKKRIEAALASTTYSTGAGSAATQAGMDGLDFGLNVTRVYQDPGEAAERKAMRMQAHGEGTLSMEDGGGADSGLAFSPQATTTMSPAVVRISSVSRGLARTHTNLKRRLLREGLSSQKGSLSPVKEDGILDMEFEEDEENAEEATRRPAENESDRERALRSKISALEAVRNDLVHKLASLRVNAVNAVMQSHNVVKFLASASREEMTRKVRDIEEMEGEEGEEEEEAEVSGLHASAIPSWKPVSEAVRNLLSETSDFASLGNQPKEGFSFGMDEAEREAFLVAQAEAELTQSAVNCLESLWQDRVKRLEDKVALASKKGEETHEHESTLLQDLASARAKVATLQEELDFSRKELTTLKHVYESLELEERSADHTASGEAVAAPRAEMIEGITEITEITAPPAPSATGAKRESPGPAPKPGKVGSELISAVQLIKPYNYRSPPKIQASPGGEPKQDKVKVDQVRQQMIISNYEDIQKRQEMLSLEVTEAVENLKYIDEKLVDLDDAATTVGEKVESYLTNLTTMEESYDRNKVKLGQIEQEIYEQDLRIAQVKASVATAATQQGKKAVTFASPPQQASSPSPLREKKENTTPVAAAVSPAGVGNPPPRRRPPLAVLFTFQS